MIYQLLSLFVRDRSRCMGRVVLCLILCGGLWSSASAQDTTDIDTTAAEPRSALSDSLQERYDQLRARADSLDTLVSGLLHNPGLPQFRKLRAAGGISRGVVAGGLVSLELSSPLLTKDPQVILSGLPGSKPEVAAIQGLKIPINDLTDTILTVRVPDSLPRGEYQVQVLMAGQEEGKPDVLQRPRVLYIEPLTNIILLSLLPLIVLGILLVFVTRRSTSTAGIKGLQLLFVEPQNMTYSVSRVQFVFWVTAIAWGYMFLFFARGLVEDVWAFPPLSGFIYTFLISLGTLVGAQATSSMKGVKGAGQPYPSVADLVMHGGVFALERVQQILWTLISIGIFLFTIMKNYANATAMPDIPEELLILMGISSAGYLLGKAARKPGPVIHQVRVSSGSLLINIIGEHLSRNAVLWIDGNERPEKPTVVVADQQAPNEFAKEVQFRLDDAAYPKESALPIWQSAPHTVVIVHPDGQRCEWMTTPRILNVSAEPGSEEGTVTLSITAEHLPSEAALEVTGATKVGSVTRDPKRPNIWNVTVQPTNPNEKSFDEIRIPYGTNQVAIYAWNMEVDNDVQNAQEASEA